MSRVEIGQVFAENLSLVIQARQINANQLTDALGRSDQGAVSRWRNGKHLPKLPELARIAEALDLPAYALLVPRPDPEMVLKALKVSQGDVSADRDMSIERAGEILVEAACWTKFRFCDRTITTLRTVSPDAAVDVDEPESQRQASIG